ncbi:MAG TPA: FCD domain-containing protein [Planctomycetaceae bacterium]|nr:FCD domain-containing protein [Planctomycetaceae bacterium]
MLETLPRRKIRDDVAQRIKEFIAVEQLVPGDRLPTETALAETCGVSRLSVREATKALEFLGIVESKTGVGLTVGQIDLTRMTDHLGFHPALHRVDPLQLIDSRIIVEIGVVPHVARRMAADPSIHASLQAIVDRFRSARDLQKWIDLDIEFHRSLLAASGLSPLVAFGDLLQVFFQRFRDSIKKAEWKRGIESHQRIIDLLRGQDISGAAAELQTHIESHKRRLGAVT